jgi:hypothetical protein
MPRKNKSQQKWYLKDNQIYNTAGIQSISSIAPGLKIRGASYVNGSPDFVCC